MKVLFAPDSFKGCATSEHIIDLLTQAITKVFADCEIVSVPMADGGEGTLDILVKIRGGRYETHTVTGPLGEQTEARYGVLEKDGLVIVEMAQTCGLTLIEKEKRNPCRATSYGVGELIRYVLEKGYRNICLTIGGSATNDGGIGAADALGVRFYDGNEKRLNPIGENLGKIEEINTEGLIPELKDANITIMCDVQNPLTGENGATYVYGKQKGGNRKQLELLENGMAHYARVLKKKFGRDVTEIQGAGAAGGISIPFIVFGNAKISSGIQEVLKLIHFEKLLEGVDFVVTGEGRADWQSSYGKVLSGIGRVCNKKGIPVCALVGGIGSGAENLYTCGIDSMMSAVSDVMGIEKAIGESDALIVSAAERMFRLIKMGMKTGRCENLNERKME